MMNLIKYKSVGESKAISMIKNGFSTLLLKSPQKGLVPSHVERLERDMFQAGNIPILFSGRQSLNSLVPHQCNKSHMLTYFVRSLVSSLASQLSGQTPRQEPKTKENKVIRSSKLQRESSCGETSSTKVSLNQFPGLMIHGMVRKSKTRRLLRLNPDTGYFEQEQDVAAAANHDHSHHNELQVPNWHVCRGSAYGWLFLIDGDLDMKLLNPFSGAEIQLPSMKTIPQFEGGAPTLSYLIFKAVFSANPSVEPRPVVLIIFVGLDRDNLAFCKPGDKGWTPLMFPIKQKLFEWRYVNPVDAVYHNGQFYVLSYPGYVAAFDIGRCIDDDDLSVKTTVVATPAKRELTYQTKDWHLVVLDGELVRFELLKGCFYDCCIDKIKKRMEGERLRDGDTTDDEKIVRDFPIDYESGHVGVLFANTTYGIKIRRFDKSVKQWVTVENLGDKAVFLGLNTSFALSASDYPAGVCIPNSIYFTQGAYELSDCGWKYCFDMGIYNVKDKSIKPLYLMPMDSDELKPAPVWIVDASDGCTKEIVAGAKESD